MSLRESHARELRARANELGVKVATLARQLLEKALDDRASESTGGAEKLLAELRTLSRAHYNATLKLLRTAGGMSTAEVTEWAKLHLDR